MPACHQPGCERPAVVSLQWPKKAPVTACQEHGERARRAARSVGYDLRLTLLEAVSGAPAASGQALQAAHDPSVVTCAACEGLVRVQKRPDEVLIATHDAPVCSDWQVRMAQVSTLNRAERMNLIGPPPAPASAPAAATPATPEPRRLEETQVMVAP